MTHKLAANISFRVHPELKRRIWAEAKAVRMRPTEYTRRRLEAVYNFNPDVYETHENGTETHIAWSDPDADEE